VGSAAAGKGVHSARWAAGLSPWDNSTRAGALNFYSFTGGGFDGTDRVRALLLQLLLRSMAERPADGDTATLVSPDGVAAWKLPDEVYRVLRDVMEAMSQGLAITVAPQPHDADDPGSR
jgi:hypothetical protein